MLYGGPMSAETDGQRLDRLLGDRNRAEFARAHGIAGGGSMISQHVSGNRPISIEAAVGYSRGLGLPLEAISTEVAARVRDAAERLSPALAQPPATAPSTQPTQISLADALPVVLDALGSLTAGQWRMVRARLDDMPEHPEMRDDVASDVLPVLQAAATKHHRAG